MNHAIVSLARNYWLKQNDFVSVRCRMWRTHPTRQVSGRWNNCAIFPCSRILENNSIPDQVPENVSPRRRRHLKHLTGAAFNDATTQAKRSVDHAHWMEYVRSQRCGDNAPLFPQKKPERLYRIKTRSRNVRLINDAAVYYCIIRGHATCEITPLQVYQKTRRGWNITKFISN